MAKMNYKLGDESGDIEKGVRREKHKDRETKCEGQHHDVNSFFPKYRKVTFLFFSFFFSLLATPPELANHSFRTNQKKYVPFSRLLLIGNPHPKSSCCNTSVP